MNNDASFINSLVNHEQHPKSPVGFSGNGVETPNQEDTGGPNYAEVGGKITEIGPNIQETMINTIESAGGMGGAEDQNGQKEVVNTIGDAKGVINIGNETPATTVKTTRVPSDSNPNHIRYDEEEELFITRVVEDRMEGTAHGSK